jgi:hypothetical protein
MKSKDLATAPPTQQRSFGLTKMSDVRRFLAICINQTMRDEMSESKLRSLSYAVQVLTKILEADDVEQRLEELEKVVYHAKQAA